MKKWNCIAKLTVGVIVWGLAAPPVRAQSSAEPVYKAKCAACHSANGAGDTVVGKKLGAHDFRSADVQKQTDAELAGIIAKGKNKMPSYEKTLKADETTALVAYIRELGKAK
jgi:mono/diheme cytochrome c family protein